MKKKLIIILISLLIVFSMVSCKQKDTATEDSGGYIAAPTVSYAMGITTEFSQQLELADYEKQTGEKLEFTGNPLFAEKEKSKELPSVDKRLPSEPLVVLPYDVIGRYGGQLKGMCISYESGTSEVEYLKTKRDKIMAKV